MMLVAPKHQKHTPNSRSHSGAHTKKTQVPGHGGSARQKSQQSLQAMADGMLRSPTFLVGADTWSAMFFFFGKDL